MHTGDRDRSTVRRATAARTLPGVVEELDGAVAVATVEAPPADSIELPAVGTVVGIRLPDGSRTTAIVKESDDRVFWVDLDPAPPPGAPLGIAWSVPGGAGAATAQVLTADARRGVVVMMQETRLVERRGFERFEPASRVLVSATLLGTVGATTGTTIAGEVVSVHHAGMSFRSFGRAAQGERAVLQLRDARGELVARDVDTEIVMVRETTDGRSLISCAFHQRGLMAQVVRRIAEQPEAEAPAAC